MSESDAVSYLEQAEGKLKSKGWFGLGGAKYDEAADLYAKAANAYKLVKMCRTRLLSLQRTSILHTHCHHDTNPGKEAGNAFMEQGKTLERGGEKDEAANAYINASKAYKKTHPKGISLSLKTQKGLEI